VTYIIISVIQDFFGVEANGATVVVEVMEIFNVLVEVVAPAVELIVA
jgi:hypothetical protein